MKEKTRMDETIDLVEIFLSDASTKTMSTTMYKNDAERLRKYLKRNHSQLKLAFSQRDISQERATVTIFKEY